MTGFSGHNWEGFRKLFPASNFSFSNNCDPITLEACELYHSWKFELVAEAVLQPLLVAVLEGVVHRLKNNITQTERSTYPFFISLFDPFLRLKSQVVKDRTMTIVDGPFVTPTGHDSQLSNPNTAAAGGRVVARRASRTQDTAGQGAPNGSGAAVGANSRPPLAPCAKVESAALGLNEYATAAGSGTSSVKSLLTAFEKVLAAGGSAGPCEFVLKEKTAGTSPSDVCLLLVEVKLTLEHDFKKSMAQICHQLIAMALYNRERNLPGPVHGMLTGGYKWIGVKLQLTDVPGGPDVQLQQLRGHFEYSSVYTILTSSALEGYKITTDFKAVVSTLAKLLMPEVIEKGAVDVEASLNTYASKMKRLAAGLASGRGISVHQASVIENDEPNQPGSKRLKTQHVAEPYSHELELAAAAVAKLCRGGDAFGDLCAATKPLTLAVIQGAVEQAYAACDKVNSDLKEIRSALASSNRVKSKAAIEFLEHLRQLAAVLTGASASLVPAAAL